MSSVRHFLTLMDLSKSELNTLIQRAITLKQSYKDAISYTPLQHRTLAMIFDKASTRTRVSFEVGMTQLGGHALFLSSQDTQLGRGEPIKDSARIISSMTDIVMIRTFAHETVEEFAEYSTVPVINALTDDYHPCQLLADVMTYVEVHGSIEGKTVAWIGDGNNMCHSWMNAAQQFGFHLNIACPKGYEPNAALAEQRAEHISISHNAEEAVLNADIIATDVWASMGQEKEQKKREKAFADFQVNESLMALGNKEVMFMHCLPAHRGEEVTEGVLEGKQSIVWQEAENRLHVQKAVIEFLLFG